MSEYQFMVVATGLNTESDDWVDQVYEAGCDDATVALQRGLLIFEFDREATSFAQAVTSACHDIRQAGALVVRIEPDPLVSLADIARRTGLTRAAISNYRKGDRGEDFPTPIARVTTDSPLWDWVNVAQWLHGRGQLDEEAVKHACLIREANRLIDSVAGCALDEEFARHLPALKQAAPTADADKAPKVTTADEGRESVDTSTNVVSIWRNTSPMQHPADVECSGGNEWLDALMRSRRRA